MFLKKRVDDFPIFDLKPCVDTGLAHGNNHVPLESCVPKRVGAPLAIIAFEGLDFDHGLEPAHFPGDHLDNNRKHGHDDQHRDEDPECDLVSHEPGIK